MLPSLQGTSRTEERSAAFLAFIAGYIDAYSLIIYKTYVSFMSGNSTQTGSQIGQGNLLAVAPALLAIVFFVIGVFAGTLLAHSRMHQPHRLLFGLIAALLATVITLAQLDLLDTGVAIATLSLAMGFMNTALSHVGAQSVNLVFVTGTLNTMAQHLALAVKHASLPEAQGAWDTHLRRAFLLFGVWGSFVAGALVVGFALPRLGAWILLLPLLSLVVLAIFRPARASSE